MKILSMLLALIIWSALMYGVFLEAGPATGILLVMLSTYSYIGIHGNSLHAFKLHDIINDLNKAINLIRKRIE